MIIRFLTAFLLLVVSLSTHFDQAHSGTPDLIYSIGAGSHKPAAAMNQNGVSVVVWEQTPGPWDEYDVYGIRFDVAGNQLGSFRANTYTTSIQREPSVAIDNAGNFIVAWSSYEQDGEGDEIYFQRYDASGVPQGTETRANNVLTGDQRPQDMDIDDMGRFVIVWYSSGISGDPVHPRGVYGRRFDSIGSPLGEEFFVAELSAQRPPAVAVNSSGNFSVTWCSAPETEILARNFDLDGNPTSPPFFVSTIARNYQASPDVVVADDGVIIFVWEAWKDGSSMEIFARRFQSDGTPVGDEFVINTLKSGNQKFPAIDMTENGDFIVVWQCWSSDPFLYGILSQRYSFSGEKIGQEFPISTVPVEQGPRRPSVAYSTSGFITAWEWIDRVYIEHIPVLPVDVQQTTWGDIKSQLDSGD
jgi:hypothetical protein